MKQVFLRHEGQPCLLLFFAGWGAEEALFDPPTMPGHDCLLCYDYRSASFDASLLAPYAGIRLLAWSMGVRVAADTLSGLSLPWERRLAVGGTMTPVDDGRGIPEATFRATLAGFNGQSMLRFRRRMCGSSAESARIAALPLHRRLDDLREELDALWRRVEKSPAPAFNWDAALIGTSDRIFPPENLRRAWAGVPQTERPTAHYDRALFHELLSEETLWTNT